LAFHEVKFQCPAALPPSSVGAPVLLRLTAVSLKAYGLFALLAWEFLNAVNLTGPGPFAHAAEGREAEPAVRRVTRVVDGDTLILSPNDRVRLIGVDTPETVHPQKTVECYGKEAKEFTRSTVVGQNIRLVLDDANAARRHKDRYGRTLGYVYLQDGVMLNAELLRRGFAHAYTRFPFRYLVEFRRLEQEARGRGVGLWSRCSVSSELLTWSGHKLSPFSFSRETPRWNNSSEVWFRGTQCLSY